MNSFTMNGYFWKIRFVEPSSPMLVDRTNTRTVATTDPKGRTVYLSTVLHGDMLNRVLLHELGHCAMVSYGLLDDVHSMVHPQFWIEAEEWICNFIADYGFQIFSAAYTVLGEAAWLYVPYELDRRLA